MKTTLQKAACTGLVAIVIGLGMSEPSVTPVPEAMAAEWTDGTLEEVRDATGTGVHRETGELEPLARIDVRISGKLFALDRRVAVQDSSGKQIPFAQLVPNSKIRYRAEQDVVRAIVLLEVLPR